MMANSMKVDFNMAAMRINLDNLFNGNKVLGNYRTHKILNTYFFLICRVSDILQDGPSTHF